MPWKHVKWSGKLALLLRNDRDRSIRYLEASMQMMCVRKAYRKLAATQER